jgi:hypothetical protein
MQITKGEGRVEKFCVRSEEITPGVIILYTLRPDQRPRHPEKEWRGKVLRYDRVFHRAMVESLEEGYEACEEDVRFEQIVRIENQSPSHHNATDSSGERLPHTPNKALPT